MNDRKVAFIICYNNEQYIQECIKYISQLKVPEGIETDIIGVEGAESMASGYNAAMENSDAKYKVYLHQDVFILNENLIEDMVRIFQNNPEYGMLGVIGTDKVVKDANYWNSWNIGVTAAFDSIAQGVLVMENRQEMAPALIVDGMIMMTQYDVRWREDVFDGFDFYDVSQSMEFQIAGYRVGIPHQGVAWCNHDCGASELKRYDYYREKFCREYADYGYEFSACEEQSETVKKCEKIEENLYKIEAEILNKNIAKALSMIIQYINFCDVNGKLWIYYIICRIVYEENKQGIKDGFYKEGMEISTLIEKFNRYKFFFTAHRIGFSDRR